MGESRDEGCTSRIARIGAYCRATAVTRSHSDNSHRGSTTGTRQTLLDGFCGRSSDHFRFLGTSLPVIQQPVELQTSTFLHPKLRLVGHTEPPSRTSGFLFLSSPDRVWLGKSIRSAVSPQDSRGSEGIARLRLQCCTYAQRKLATRPLYMLEPRDS